MKILFCVLGTVLCALSTSAFPTPKQDVPPQCIDPTFACQDLESAKTCGVVKECVHEIWATMAAPDDNDEICDICKEMVKEARDQLLSNMTQEEIKEVFEGSCKLVPIQLVADACIKVVDEIIPELVEMLSSRMDPNMVCTVSGLCNVAHSIEESPIEKYLRMILVHRQDNQCSDCMTMAADVKTFLKDSTEEEVETEIKKICDEKIPKYLCDIVMNSYFPSLYSYVINTDAKTLCSSAGVCPKVPKICNLQETQVNDELTCEFCEHVLQHIKDLVTANTTAEEFRTALMNFCKHMGSFSDKCTSLVDDYYDMLFDYIRKLDTNGVCTLIGLCNNQECSHMNLIKLVPAVEARKRIPMAKIVPASRVTVSQGVQPLIKLVPATVGSKKEMRESNDIFPPQLPLERLVHPLSIFQKDTECAFCRAISFYLEQDLKGDNSKEGVRKALENVCDKWVTEFPTHCKNFLSQYSEKIERAIVKGVKLEDVCVFSKACIADDSNPELNVRVIHKAKEGPFCDLCKDTFNEIESTLSDPATKKKIENVLDRVCSILPESLTGDCTSFVNSNVDAMMDILQQELKPDNVCPALRLCDEKLRIVVSPRVKDLECDLCKDAFSSLRQQLSDPNAKKAIVTFLEEGCASLPGSLAEECKTFIDGNIDTLMGLIIQELDPDRVCSYFKFCPASLKRKEVEKVKDIECDLCKEVVGKVEDLIKDKKTEDEIQSALDKVCSYLPSSFTDKCKTFVNQYTETLITLLMEEMDPDMVCAVLNVCPASLKKKEVAKVKDMECDVCKQVVQQVEDLIKDKKTEDEIQSALDKVCSYFPASFADKCETFVNQYTKTLITLLMQEMNPDMVCAALNVCPASLKRKEVEKVKDVECDLCKEVVGKVEDMIKDRKTEDEIKSALEKVCSYLPSSMSAKCKAFVDQYTETLITLLMEEMDPDMICAAMNVCPANAQYPEWQSKAKDLECQGCQYVLHYVQEQLSNAETEEEIKNLLKKMCDVLPQTYAKNCDGFVDEYGSALCVLVAQELDPSKMCYEMQMCTNQTKLFKRPVVDTLHPFKTDECSVCTTVVDYVDKLLEEDDVDKEITHLVEKVCTVLPASYKDKCNTMLETYGPYILQMIGQLADSEEVCQEIDLCARPPGHVHLLGGDKCTFGPSYWCKSSAHASACKAEMFCKEKFWKN